MHQDFSSEEYIPEKLKENGHPFAHDLDLFGKNPFFHSTTERKPFLVKILLATN